MTKFDLFRHKNEMLFANYAATVIGAGTAFLLAYRSVSHEPQQALRLATQMAWFFEPFWLILMFVLTIRYERPIRRFLNHSIHKEPIPAELTTKARQRLLNEPFFLIALDLCMWLSAAVFYSLVLWKAGAGRAAVFTAFSKGVQTGLITVVAAFFLLRSVLQRTMVPQVFPTGGLCMIPKTLRIRISTRLAALLLACNLIPFFAIINILRSTFYATDDPAALIIQMRSDIFLNSFIFMGTGIFLTTLVSLNLQRPFREITQVLRAVSRGQFDQKVQVTSNDEIGYTGDVINEMTEGLRERDRMRQSLELAKEVQQSLLPQSDPKVAGLDIAGQSIYCERTGGDYYDYLPTGKSQDGKIGIVVGDVSGHGIPSALLMAAVRSSLRQRVMLPGGIAQIISDVNRQLARDVGESARFMTLFYSEIDAQNRCIRWVRAGHDPAILYDPETDTFNELKGPGVALGVEESWIYEENIKDNLKINQIIVICTDGVWEAHNATGEMFGKESLYELIRDNSGADAMEIVDAVVAALKQFQKGVASEDDVTMVVIKIVS